MYGVIVCVYNSLINKTIIGTLKVYSSTDRCVYPYIILGAQPGSNTILLRDIHY